MANTQEMMNEADPDGFVMPFGPFAGQTLDQIASTRDGWHYLDRLVREKWPEPDMRLTIEIYLFRRLIEKQLKEFLGFGRRNEER